MKNALLIIALLSSALLRAQVCFGPVTNYFSPGVFAGNTPYSLSSADFNSDGLLDIAIVNYCGSVSVFTGIGAGSFGTATSYTIISYGIFPGAADFNEDSHTDLAITMGYSDRVAIFLNNGSGGFSPANYELLPFDTTVHGITAADFNNDAHVDLAVTGELSDNVRILLGSGTGSFTVGASIPLDHIPCMFRTRILIRTETLTWLLEMEIRIIFQFFREWVTATLMPLLIIRLVQVRIV